MGAHGEAFGFAQSGKNGGCVRIGVRARNIVADTIDIRGIFAFICWPTSDGPLMYIIYESPHDKNNKMTVRPAKTDQTSAQSNQSLRCVLSGSLRIQAFCKMTVRPAKTQISLGIHPV